MIFRLSCNSDEARRALNEAAALASARSRWLGTGLGGSVFTYLTLNQNMVQPGALWFKPPQRSPQKNQPGFSVKPKKHKHYIMFELGSLDLLLPVAVDLVPHARLHSY